MNEMLFYFCCLLLLPFFQTRFGWLALLFKLPFPETRRLQRPAASARTCGCSGCTLKHTNFQTCLRLESEAEQTQTPSLTSDSSYAHLLPAFLQPESHFVMCWYAKQLLLRGQRVDDRRALLCLHAQTETQKDLFLFFLGVMFFITSLLTQTAPCATFIAALKNT